MTELKLDMSPLQDTDADEPRFSRRGMFLIIQVIGLSHPDLHHVARLLQETLHCAAALPGTEQRIVMSSLSDQFFCLIQMVEMAMCHEDRIILQKFLRRNGSGSSCQFQKWIEQDLLVSALKYKCSCSHPGEFHSHPHHSAESSSAFVYSC